MSASRTSKSNHTQNAPKPIFDGRLNLEQQRKRAKELLRDIRAENPDAQSRASQAGHKFTSENAQLADAQLIIARENGFASWPKMKSHIDHITERNRQIANGKPPVLDTQNTLHLRCGSDIRHGLEIAGFVGEFLEFADPFCQGPVPDLPLNQFIEIRAKFIAEDYLIAPNDALARAKREYGALTTLGDFDHVVLWFEHDSYDQLILAFLMDFFNAIRPNTTIEVISVGEVPGIDRFIGLGQLSPELLIWCWESHRRPLTDAMLEFGSKAWHAIRSPDPKSLETFITSAQGTTAPLPHMIKALERHHAELPDPKTGLGLTQKITLQILKDHGPITAGKVFGHLMRSYDPLPFLGDLMFWADIKGMMQCHEPLLTITPNPENPIWAERILALTETGDDTLTGNRNFLDNFTGIRWVGGVRVLAK
ncbi:MAG: DUF1835 domain-containing protein [Thalassospira sp.]|uniref:DUF1835 domain-containing protein n=1 Tax=Thalassospira sp. TaxID=1912094 RepID=UPI003A862883